MYTYYKVVQTVWCQLHPPHTHSPKTIIKTVISRNISSLFFASNWGIFFFYHLPCFHSQHPITHASGERAQENRLWLQQPSLQQRCMIPKDLPRPMAIEACHNSVDWWVEFELDHGDQGRHLSINKYLLSSQSKVKSTEYRDHQTSFPCMYWSPHRRGSYQTFRWFPTMNHQETPPGCQIEKTPSEKSGSSSFDPGTTSVGPAMLLFYYKLFQFVFFDWTKHVCIISIHISCCIYIFIYIMILFCMSYIIKINQVFHVCAQKTPYFPLLPSAPLFFSKYLYGVTLSNITRIGPSWKWPSVWLTSKCAAV